MSAEFFKACERVLSATANGVYQGMLVALVAGFALRLFVRANAATRHAVWFGVLAFVTALIPAHLLLSWRAHPEILAPVIGPSPSLAAIARAPFQSGNRTDWPVANSDLLDLQPAQSGFPGIDAPANITSAALPEEPLSANNDSNARPSLTPPEKPSPILSPAMLKPLARRLETAVSLPHPVSLCLVAAWVLLAGVRAVMIVGRIGDVRRVKRTSIAPSPGLQTIFDDLRGSLATRRNVRLRISNAHRSAAVMGFVHPVVLLPAEMDSDANPSEIEHVLRHELAHVDRRDDWANLAQQVVQAALFFHPAVWWISSKLSLEREIACDDRVLEASGRPRAYALTLANVAVRMNHCRHLLAPGVSNNNSQLQQRITMILNTQRNRSPRLATRWLGVFTTATAMLAVLALGFGPRLVLAQPVPEDSAPSAPAQPALPLPPPVPVASGAVLAGPAPMAALPLAPPVTPPPMAALPPAPPEPETPLLAAAVPATPPPDWSGAESGPRPKAQTSDDASAPDISPAPAAEAFPQAESIAPIGRVVSVAPIAAAAAVTVTEGDISSPDDARPRIRPGKRHMSIEERLDRIERILDELQADGKVKGHHFGADAFQFRGIPQGQPGAMGADSVDVYRDYSAQASKMAEQAKRMAEASERAAERATEKMERDLNEKVKNLESLDKMGIEAKGRLDEKGEALERLSKDLQDSQSKAPLLELQALRSARESLNREVENLNRQIKKLEQEKNSLKKRDKSDPSADDGSKLERPGHPRTS
jgi:beta-lactamase regulating signal transducer with metallopeptidase domain